MNADIVIRPLRLDERADLGAAVEGLSRFLQDLGAASRPTTPPGRGCTIRTSRCGCSAATVDGKLLGIVHYLYHRSCWTVGDYCYLQDLFVAEGARKLGLGRALIEAVYREARAAGASRVYWTTHETNATARALYDTLADRPGFIQYRKLF